MQVDLTHEIAALKEILERERQARKAVELILEQKSSELYAINQKLEEKVKERTEVLTNKNEELLATSTRMMLLVQNLQNAVWMEDEFGNTVLVNQQFCDLFHLPFAPADLVGCESKVILNRIAGSFKEQGIFDVIHGNYWAERAPVGATEVHLQYDRIVLVEFIPIWANGIYKGNLWVLKDVTQQRIADQKLKDQKAFYEDILNNVPADLAVIDKDQRYMFVNPKAIRNPEVREWIIGKTDADYCRMRGKNMEIAKKRQERYDLIKKFKKEQQWEEQSVKPDGSMEYIFRHLAPILDEKGEIRMFIGYATDITARKMVEKRASSLWFSLERLGDNVWEHDFQTNETFFSKQEFEMLGTKEEPIESNAKLWWDRVHPEDRNILKKNDELYKAGLIDHHSLEYRIYHNDGSIHWVLDRGMVTEKSTNGLPLKILGTHTDITFIKNIQKEGIKSAERYQSLIENSLALICIHDLKGLFQSVNPAILNAFNYTSEEMIGKPVSDFMPEDQRALFQELYLDNIRKYKKAEGVFSVLAKDGRKIYLLYHNFLMEQEDEEPYVIGFSLDITERIKAEKELKIAKKATEEIAKAKEAFLANMSHEIRTPMNGVMGIAGLLAKTALNPQQQQYLKLIQESSKNLLMIVNDVLDLEKIVMGKLQFENVPFRLAERVEMCIQGFTFKAEEKDIVLAFDNKLKDNLVVTGDPYRLSQVLNNLISNALKFTEKGSVRVVLTELSAEGTRHQIEVRIEDTGIGIPADKLKEIFEPFVQASSSVSRMYGGTGLGLSICKEIVSMMGGYFDVKSDSGKGSVFTFIVPFEESTVIPDSEKTTTEINFQSLGSRRVLVAEDVELNQYLVKHILQSWGFEVCLVNNGAEALSKVQEEPFDLVLMDIQMPILDGMEATRQIRKLSNPSVASIPIIALTANALKGDSEKYLGAGMNDYLAKPFDETKLFIAISNILQPQNMGSMSLAHKNSKMETFDKLYDLSMVETISGGDQGFVKKMVQLFVDTMPATLSDLQQNAAAGNWEQTGKVAHKLKSTIDSMGITSLKDDIRTVESNGKTATNTDAIQPLVEKVVKIVNACIDQIKTEFGL